MEQYKIRANWYALLVTILTDKSADDSLRDMGIYVKTELADSHRRAYD